MSDTNASYSEAPGGAYREIIRERNAEIERLKAQATSHDKVLEACRTTLRERKKLITELADALESFVLHVEAYAECDEDRYLLRRAREAIE